MTITTFAECPGGLRRFFRAVLVLLVVTVAILLLDEFGPVLWVEAKVAFSAPGAGATREQVENWLDRQDICHTRHADSGATGGYLVGETRSEFGTLLPGVRGEYVVGRFPVAHVYGWMSDVWLYFFFDADGRLIQHTIKRRDRYL